MRINTRSRRFRFRTVRVCPSTIRKTIIPIDSCAVFWDGNDVRDEANAAYSRPDPLGIDEYNLPYSMNKKERWTIPERLREEIEELQDPHHNLRVSASLHVVDTADKNGVSEMRNDIKNLQATSYHTVSRDGETVTNNYAKKGTARLQTLINPKGLKPWDPRKDQYKRKKQREDFEENLVIKPFLPEENVENQKLHVQYLATEMVSKASTYNKLPRESKQSKKRTTTGRKRLDLVRESMMEEEEEEEEEEEGEDLSLSPPAPASLGSFLVPPPSRHAQPRHRQRSKRESYKDESFRSSMISLISGEINVETSSDEDERSIDTTVLEDVVIVESPSNIVLVTPLPQLYTRVRVERLARCAPLAVSPRTWIVHSRDTVEVLGRALPYCIVAKDAGNGDAKLFAHERCLKCADRWGHYTILLEERGDAASAAAAAGAADTCLICCRPTPMVTVFEHDRPFGLGCSHTCCTGCWLQHVSEGMKKGRGMAQCPEPSCALTLSVVQAAALMDSASLLKYTESISEALLRQQAIVKCRDCSRLHRVIESKPAVRCVCGTSLCALCSSVAHSPVSCKAFREYCEYMQKNGLSAAHVSAADAPIVRGLSQCPRCGVLGEKMWEWCENLICECGFRFCAKCNQKWTSEHWNCQVEGAHKSITMIDVSTTRDTDLQSNMLMLSIGARLTYFEKRKEVMERVQTLSIKERKEFDKTFARLSHLMEICYLNSTKSKRSLVLAERIQFAMNYFFNTTDKNRRNLVYKKELLTKIANDISTELFGAMPRVQKKSIKK